jgi:tol-pal system protein YbgF
MSTPIFRLPVNPLRAAAVAAGLLLVASPSWALFEDDEARRAILEVRSRVQAQEVASQRMAEDLRRATEENANLRRSLLDLQGQIDAVRGDMARMTGQNEQLQRDLAESQRRQADMEKGMADRLAKFEPATVTVDGKSFTAEPDEVRDYETALATFRKGDFTAAQGQFVRFVQRYPRSGYAPSALFWLGNAQYATRSYKEAIENFRQVITLAPDHMRAPEAVLSIANCQIELKDTRAARKTLEDLAKAYPQSEAAAAGKDRLARLR